MADLKQLARVIFRETLASIDIPGAMRRKLGCEGRLIKLGEQRFDPTKFSRVGIIAMGKAAHTMVAGLMQFLPSSLRVEGIVCGPVAPAEPVLGLRYFVGGHPTPNSESWK